MAALRANPLESWSKRFLEQLRRPGFPAPGERPRPAGARLPQPLPRAKKSPNRAESRDAASGHRELGGEEAQIIGSPDGDD